MKINLARKVIPAGLLFLQLSAFSFHSRGAAGDVDLSFDTGSGVNGTVKAVAVQPDGKVIIGGAFTTVKGLVRTNFARLNTDGSGDATFDAGNVADEYVTAIVVQADGKVIFTRDFYNVTGAPAGHQVARLNSDGTLDPSFAPDIGTFASGSGLMCVAVQPDGKLVLGGYFNDFYVDDEGRIHYHKRSLLIRLNADGTADASFIAIHGEYGGSISSLALQSNGKILIGGDIRTTINGTNYFGLARLDNGGALDSGFIPGVDGFVLSVAVQADGKSLIGGSLIGNGPARNAVARLNADGSRDGSFQPGTDENSSLVSLAVQPDGKVLLSGGGIYVNGVSRNGIVRLHADGSVDSGFNAVLGAPDNAGAMIAVQSDGKIYLGGAFTMVNDTSREHIARLSPDGGLDIGFEPGASINGPIHAIILQPDGKLLLRGPFTTVHGATRNRVARLHASGTVDTGFNPEPGVSGGSYALEISATAVQPDGKVMIGGGFNSVSGTSRYRLARLHSNGTVDDSFVSGVGGIGFDPRPVQAIVVLANGGMLIAEPGGIDGLNPPKKIARLDASGNVDSAFNPTISAGEPHNDNTEVNSLVLQEDGKILVAGRSLYDDLGYHAALLLRLNAEGSVDAGFERTDTAGPSVVTVISAVALQPDGKVLIGGNFSSIKGTNRNGIARLNADGTLDNTFDPGSGITGTSDPTVFSIHVQPDGRILIGGSFSSFNGIGRKNFARLNTDGSLDANFNTGSGTDDIVRSIVLQPDGRVLIAGDFTAVNGVVRPRVARLFGDFTMPSLSIARSSTFSIVSWPVTAVTFLLEESTNLALSNSWSVVAQPLVTNGNHVLVSVSATNTGRFFRLQSQ